MVINIFSFQIYIYVNLFLSYFLFFSLIKHFFFFFFSQYFYSISSDFSDLPDMTDEYIDLSVYALTAWLL